MKSVLLLDQFCNPVNAPEYLRAAITFTAKHGGKPEPIFPMGTVFEGDQALAMCMTGQCAPSDAECVKALGWPEEKLRAVQLNCRMNNLGIMRTEDRELYAAGVIAGYDKDLNYIHGPNWAKYQAAKETVAKSEDDI
mgnify:FL=1